jgi:hypothetical protein
MDRNNKIISFQLERGCHFGWILKKAGIRKLHPSSKFQPNGWNNGWNFEKGWNFGFLVESREYTESYVARMEF